MKPISSLTFYDRAAGKVTSELVFASRFLTWSYNTTLGFWLTKFVLRQKLISKLYGLFHKSRLSRKKIQPFVKKMNVNMRESLIPFPIPVFRTMLFRYLESTTRSAPIRSAGSFRFTWRIIEC